MTSPLLEKLKADERKGSKPRCHWLTHGAATDVAGRLADLIEEHGAVAATNDWMPRGFDDVAEAQLHLTPELFDRPTVCDDLKAWWFATSTGDGKSPCWDVAATCTIDGRPGVLLVEAKAHELELQNESGGKRLKASASADSRANHTQIGRRISQVSEALAVATGLPWHLNHDDHYQLSNRFAWAHKLASMGYPVVLLYLGFLGAEEMRAPRSAPFSDSGEWTRAVLEHSAGVVPEGGWNCAIGVGEASVTPLIRAARVALDGTGFEIIA